MGNARATTDSRSETLSELELWKAQLAYVSGTILAWGALLLKLWPVLARLQTGAHIHALGRDENVVVPVSSYYLLALLVAVGLGMLLFGAAHIVARGFWLTHVLTHGAAARNTSWHARIARNTYVVLHVFWVAALTVFCVVPLFALSAVLAGLFADGLGWPIGLSRAAAAVLVFAGPIAVATVLLRRRLVGGLSWVRDVAGRVGRLNVGLACVALLALWAGVIEFSYVAALRLDRLVFSRSADPTIVVAVELGGAVSDPSPARVRLVAGHGKPSLTLQLRPSRKGIHVALVNTRALGAGDYVVEMSYPHASLSALFPFVRSRITREVGFVLVE